MENKESIGNVEDFQNDIDELKTNLISQDLKFEVIETNIKTNQDYIADTIKDIESNEGSIRSNSDDLEVCTSFINMKI